MTGRVVLVGLVANDPDRNSGLASQETTGCKIGLIPPDYPLII